MSLAETFAFQAVKKGNAVINITVGGVEYIAEAPPTASVTEASWRCTAIFPLENGGRFVKQAAGLCIPGVDGVNLPNLAYLPAEEEA